jgi:hypothetical protein
MSANLSRYRQAQASRWLQHSPAASAIHTAIRVISIQYRRITASTIRGTQGVGSLILSSQKYPGQSGIGVRLTGAQEKEGERKTYLFISYINDLSN